MYKKPKFLSFFYYKKESKHISGESIDYSFLFANDFLNFIILHNYNPLFF